MKILCVLILFLSFSPAFAEQKASSTSVTPASNSTPTKYQKMDLKQFDNISSNEKSDAIKFESSCTDQIGRQFKSSDPEYSRCLSEAAANNNKAATAHEKK